MPGGEEAWGGCRYADIDVACLKPMDLLIRPEDGLVAGWEDERAVEEDVVRGNFGRQAFPASTYHPIHRASNLIALILQCSCGQ